MRFYNRQDRHYCGIDLHVKTMYVCILDAAVQVLVHRNVPSTPEAFLEVVALYRDDLGQRNGVRPAILRSPTRQVPGLRLQVNFGPPHTHDFSPALPEHEPKAHGIGRPPRACVETGPQRAKLIVRQHTIGGLFLEALDHPRGGVAGALGQTSVRWRPPGAEHLCRRGAAADNGACANLRFREYCLTPTATDDLMRRRFLLAEDRDPVLARAREHWLFAVTPR